MLYSSISSMLKNGSQNCSRNALVFSLHQPHAGCPRAPVNLNHRDRVLSSLFTSTSTTGKLPSFHLRLAKKTTTHSSTSLAEAESSSKELPRFPQSTSLDPATILWAHKMDSGIEPQPQITQEMAKRLLHGIPLTNEQLKILHQEARLRNNLGDTEGSMDLLLRLLEQQPLDPHLLTSAAMQACLPLLLSFENIPCLLLENPA